MRPILRKRRGMGVLSRLADIRLHFARLYAILYDFGLLLRRFE